LSLIEADDELSCDCGFRLQTFNAPIVLTNRDTAGLRWRRATPIRLCQHFEDMFGIGQESGALQNDFAERMGYSRLQHLI